MIIKHRFLAHNFQKDPLPLSFSLFSSLSPRMSTTISPYVCYACINKTIGCYNYLRIAFYSRWQSSVGSICRGNQQSSFDWFHNFSCSPMQSVVFISLSTHTHIYSSIDAVEGGFVVYGTCQQCWIVSALLWFGLRNCIHPTQKMNFDIAPNER